MMTPAQCRAHLLAQVLAASARMDANRHHYARHRLAAGGLQRGPRRAGRLR